MLFRGLIIKTGLTIELVKIISRMKSYSFTDSTKKEKSEKLKISILHFVIISSFRGYGLLKLRLTTLLELRYPYSNEVMEIFNSIAGICILQSLEQLKIT